MVTDKSQFEVLQRDKAKWWAHRILAEKAQEISRISIDIGLLNHQAQNFDKMRPEIQDEVLNNLNAEFERLGWKYRFEK